MVWFQSCLNVCWKENREDTSFDVILRSYCVDDICGQPL